MELKTYKFEIRDTVEIDAANLSDALDVLVEQHPGIRQGALKSVTEDGRGLACVTNRDTGMCIWYRPGCICGRTDCANDPMRKIAERCSCAAKAEENWEDCSLPDPYGSECYDYRTED